jgi:predicted PurR-regulated permease PerM
VAPQEPFHRTVLRAVLVVLAVVGVLWLVYLLRKPIGWLVLALFLAVAISGPVNVLSRRMRRGAAIALSYLGLLVVPLALVAVITPSIVNGVEDLAQKAPDYAHQLRRQISNNDRLRKLDAQYGVTDRLVQEAQKLPNRLGDAASILTNLGVGIVNSVFAAVTILILSIFMVGGGRRWIDQALQTQPQERATRIRRALDRSANAVGSYVGGVLVQATIAGLSTFVVLLILGVPFAGPLAVLTALFDAIPLVGATIAAALVAIVTLFVDFPTITIVWVVWAVLYQQLENSVIQPRIQSRAVNINPFAVIVSVLFGATLFGILGAVLAVPAAATVQILGREYLQYRRDMSAREIVEPAA